MRETVVLTTRAAQAPGQAWPRLEHICEQMRAGVLEDPEYPLVILQAYTSKAVPQHARSAIEAYGQQPFAALAALVSQGQAQGTVVSGEPIELAVPFPRRVQGLGAVRVKGD